MNERDEQILRDVIGALSTVIVAFCRSLESQHRNDAFSRQPVISAIQKAAADLPPNSDNGPMIKAILGNIAAELESGNQRAVRIPFGGAGK
jgi:hypothetical protein